MSEQFALRISAGPDYQHLKVIGANDCKNPIFVNGPHFAGYISVKVRDFSGITPGLEARKLERDSKMGITKDEKPAIPTNPVAVEENDDSEGEFFDAEEGEEDLKSNASTKDLRDKLAAATMNMKDSTHLPIPKPSFPYFEGKNRRYSMMIQGRFKQQFTADEIVFGGDFDSPMIPPPGTGFLMKIAKWLDPAIDANHSDNMPYMFSPMVTAMNYLSVLDIDSKHLESGIDSNHDRISTDDSNIPDVGKWAFHSKFIPEETTILHPSKEFPSYEKRKKYFCNAQIRENTLITPDHIYAMDFYDGYFDINTAQIKMPGFSLNALKYWDGTQKLRYSLTTRDRKIVFFCIQYEFVKRKDYEINDE